MKISKSPFSLIGISRFLVLSAVTNAGVGQGVGETNTAGANQGGQTSMQIVSQNGFCLRLAAVCDGICLLLPTITLCHTEYTLILSTTKLSFDKITQHYHEFWPFF